MVIEKPEKEKEKQVDEGKKKEDDEAREEVGYALCAFRDDGLLMLVFVDAGALRSPELVLQGSALHVL